MIIDIPLEESLEIFQLTDSFLDISAPLSLSIYSFTASALAGGITLVLAMPNTSPSITDSSSLALVKKSASASARCDYGLYVGANDTNAEDLRRIVEEEGEGGKEGEEMKHNGVAALKMYLNDTFSTLKLPDMESWMSHFRNWPRELPIVCHAEGQTMGAVILLSQVNENL